MKIKRSRRDAANFSRLCLMREITRSDGFLKAIKRFFGYWYFWMGPKHTLWMTLLDSWNCFLIVFVYNEEVLWPRDSKETIMKKNTLAVYFIVVLMISSCGTQPPSETITPIASTLTGTPVPTSTSTPTIAPTSSKEPVVTPTLGTPIPTNSPGCANSASFIADVTIPDNSKVNSGAGFTKTWRVRNTGTCIWGPGYTLDYYSEERMDAPISSPLSGVTFPGKTADLSLQMTAPTTAGIHRGNFVIKNPAGLIMKIDQDSRLWLIINVTAAAGGAGTSSPTLSASAGAACSYTTDPAKVTETINAVNAYRAQNGLPAYTVNNLLTNAAAVHANDMACNNFFTHTGSNGSTPSSRVAASGYAASSVTENVYGSYPPLSGQGVVDWWKFDQVDPNHNLNLLSTKYKDIGVAYSFFNNYGYYVIVFAAP